MMRGEKQNSAVELVFLIKIYYLDVSHAGLFLIAYINITGLKD